MGNIKKSFKILFIDVIYVILKNNVLLEQTD